MVCDPCISYPFICPDRFGCPPNLCPDFEIKRHDTKPSFSVSVEDCDGPLDLTNVVVEVSMWANGKLKKALTSEDTFFALSEGIGFEQSLVGDIIVMPQVRAPEQMLIVGHDEINRFIQVQRGYHGSPRGTYPAGTAIKMFRVLNSFGSTTMATEDISRIDGTLETGVVTESRVVYTWNADDTCLPGCYYLEFKLLKMNPVDLWVIDPVPPSVTDMGCSLGAGVEWTRRVPSNQDGFLIHVFNSPTAENIV